MAPAIIGHMARCTAPVRGHRTASAEAECPACGGRYGRYGGYSSYGSYSSPSYSPCAAGPPAAARCSKQAVWLLRVDRRVLIGQEIRGLNFLPALPASAA